MGKAITPAVDGEYKGRTDDSYNPLKPQAHAGDWKDKERKFSEKPERKRAQIPKIPTIPAPKIDGLPKWPGSTQEDQEIRNKKWTDAVGKAITPAVDGEYKGRTDDSYNPL